MQILELIYHYHSLFLDYLMKIISFSMNKELILIMLIIFLLKKKEYKIATAIIFVITIKLFLVDLIMKPLFAIIRPCHLTDLELIISCPSSGSFPSGHTTAIFSLFFIVYKYFKKYFFYYLIYAGLVGFSRMYLFVHYPQDIIAGSLLGIAISYFSLKYSNQVWNLIFKFKNTIFWRKNEKN